MKKTRRRIPDRLYKGYSKEQRWKLASLRLFDVRKLVFTYAVFMTSEVWMKSEKKKEMQ